MIPCRPLAVAVFCLALTAATSLTQCTGEAGPAAGAAAALQPAGDPIRLLVSGSLLGRLEPCGCASGQLGGLARRMQHIGERRSYDLLLEGGNLVDGDTELDVLKFYTCVQVLTGMQHPYDVLGVGPKDLSLPLDEWSAFLAGAQVVAADLASEREDWPARPWLEKDVRGQIVRVTSLTLSLPPALQGEAAPVRLLPPLAAWQRAMDGAAATTLRILLLHGDEATARALVPTLRPAPDLVVGVDQDHVEPTPRSERLGDSLLVFAGIRGRVLLEVSLTRTAEGPRAACELVPLAGSKTLPGGGGDPDVKAVLLAHREQVKQEKVLERMARRLPAPNGAAYVGTETCRACHPQAYDAWSQSRHAKAWETLEIAEADPKRYGWPVTHYPDCVGCHVVGHREATGFVSFADTPQLAGVGCERCHGPGSDHLLNPAGNRLGLLGGVAASVLCVQCHDFEQSPDFVYAEKWQAIRHGREPHQQPPK
ncbi:MAG: hypothetical protein KF830_08155 [Planctomycetes bacterium]|nr:hypothetical protein [Planctomycetota bacterium]